MTLIESYIEGLYEETSDKIEATRKILFLARIPENMESLLKNGILILISLGLPFRITHERLGKGLARRWKTEHGTRHAHHLYLLLLF